MLFSVTYCFGQGKWFTSRSKTLHLLVLTKNYTSKRVLCVDAHAERMMHCPFETKRFLFHVVSLSILLLVSSSFSLLRSRNNNLMPESVRMSVLANKTSSEIAALIILTHLCVPTITQLYAGRNSNSTQNNMVLEEGPRKWCDPN